MTAKVLLFDRLRFECPICYATYGSRDKLDETDFFVMKSAGQCLICLEKDRIRSGVDAVPS